MMNTRFYIDPITELPHLYNHNVNEEEAIEVLNHPIEDRMGDNDARVAVGQTRAGRYLRVIYVHDDEPNSVFIMGRDCHKNAKYVSRGFSHVGRN